MTLSDDGECTSLSYFATAIRTKPFPQAGEVGILVHLQPLQRTRTTDARMGGQITYTPGWGNGLFAFLMCVLG